MTKENHPANDTALLAVDVGLRTGLAGFHRDGTLAWYRSRHFGTATALRKRVHAIFQEHPHIITIALEGGGPLAEIWAKEATKRNINILNITAETWRAAMLTTNEQKNGRKAKQSADPIARAIIQKSTAPRPTSLRHDAAEAILIGYYAVTNCRWQT